MEDFSRCFAVPPLPPAPAPGPDRSSQFESAISQLSSFCWAHYDGNRDCHRHSLYLGSLGCAYVRIRLAQSLSWDDDGGEKRQLLNDASRVVDRVLESEPMGRRMRITLLEGGRVGALALSAAVHHLLRPIEGEASANKESLAKSEILDIGTRYVHNQLDGSECEVLYGRSGYLHAIAFIRSETNDKDFGKNIVQQIVKAIVKEGRRVASRSGTGLPLLWEWYEEAYLGAIHGVAGILFTLLCFFDEVSLINGAVSEIKASITKLDDFCFPSGNLQPSLAPERDKLVHLCHGAPGHILLLAKAYEVLGNISFLESAEKIASNVICTRGLLKKGVGLCHGIAGNAYCFLSLYRGRWLYQQRTGDVSDKISKWLRWAYHFAGYAVDNLNDLFWVPDHPHSLYEGASGLIMLLHDLKDPSHSHFPCFEYRN